MTLAFLTLADCRIAYQRHLGNKNTGVVFLSGFGSDMEGTKASFLAAQAEKFDVPFVRFDYRGCGQSTGTFKEATIGAWFEDACAVIDQLTEGPQIVVGSSMGGWLGMLVAQARPERVKALIGVAAAPDFTEDLLWEELKPEERETLMREGSFRPEGFPLPFTWRLIEEGREHLILGKPFEARAPMRLLQGMEDTEVPWTHAVRIAEAATIDDVRIGLVKDGDHSLSRPQDLDLLWRTVGEFLA